MSQTIQDYVKLATGTSSSTLLPLVKKALKDKNIFVYGELLSLKNVQALEKGDEAQKQVFAQLNLFAFGTYEDYKKDKKQYGDLNNTQVKKLKMLTIASFGSKNSELAYGELSKALDIDNVRELEDLILEAIYAGLIEAKLDQALKTVQVDNAFGRDVKKEGIPALQETLAEWLKRSEALAGKIDEKIKYSQGEWKMNIIRREQFEEQLEKRKEQLQALLLSALEEGQGGRRRRGQGRFGLGMLQGLLRGMNK